MALSTLLLTTPIFSGLAQTNSPHEKGAPISAAAYLERLQNVDAETLKSEFENEFMVLLDKRGKQSYEALPPAARRDYIARYWQARDPDSSTSINERLEEHLRRRYYAREHFGAAETPYFDERGQVYLKYGHPLARCVDFGPRSEWDNQMTYSSSFFFALGIQRGQYDSRGLGASLFPPATVITLENESWGYDHIQPGLVFNFVRQGKHFRMVTDLRKAVSGGRRRDRTFVAAALYLQRQNVSRAHASFATDLFDVGRRSTGLPTKMLDNEIRIALERNISSIEEAMRMAPPEIFVR
jgi:GWxTD domain-containing protein